jgi:hypothetical protein
MARVIPLQQHRRGARSRHTLALDIQQRKTKHGHRWDDPDTEIESSLDSTEAPLSKWEDYHPSGFYAWDKNPLGQHVMGDLHQAKLMKEAWKDIGRGGIPPASSGNHRPDRTRADHAPTFKRDASCGADQSTEVATLL